MMGIEIGAHKIELFVLTLENNPRDRIFRKLKEMVQRAYISSQCCVAL